MIYDYHTHEVGSIEVICGPMFSGKTEELIRRVRRVEFAEIPLQVFKPAIDDRYSEECLVTHSKISFPGTSVSSLEELASSIQLSTRVVAIDEVQFFDPEVVDLMQQFANHGIRVIAAGLDLDYRSIPFKVVSELMAQAEYVTKLTAICVKCGKPASRSFRLSKESQQVLIGGIDTYDARCRHCFYSV